MDVGRGAFVLLLTTSSTNDDGESDDDDAVRKVRFDDGEPGHMLRAILCLEDYYYVHARIWTDKYGVYWKAERVIIPSDDSPVL